MPEQGVQRIEFEGQVHEFPSDFSDADIQKALSGHAQTPQPIPTPQTQPARTPQPPQTPHQAVMSADRPTYWERVQRAYPIIDRLQRGVSGLSQLAGSTPTTAEALAKPAPGMSEERAIAPEQMMSPGAQQRHPILTGAGEFAGGMTTPENLLMSGMLGAPLPRMITRSIGGIFAASMLKGAAEEYQPFRDAVARKDTSEAERIATHIMLGAIFGTTAGVRAVKGEGGVPIYEDFRRRGQAISDYARRAKSLNDVHKAGALLYGSKIQEPLLTLQTRLQQDGVASLQPALNAERAAGNKGSILPVQAQGEVAKAIEETGYNPSGPERTLLDQLAADPGDQIAQGLGYKTAAQARTKMGTAFDSYAEQVSKAVPDAKSSGMTLDDAIKLRTSLGSAATKAERSNNAKGGKVLWTAYNQLGEAIGQRVQDLTGSRTPFENYNKNFRAAFELNKGFTGDLLEPILDHHEAIPKLKTFSEADLTGVANQYMKPKGIDSRPLFQAQRDAKSLIAAHDAIGGRLRKGLYRQILSDTPSQALIPMGAYMAARGAGLYGFAPYLLATMAGTITGAASRETEAGKILRKLDIPVNRKYLELRTEAPGDPLLPTVSGGAGPEWPAAYQNAPRVATRNVGGGANYTAEQLAQLKAQHPEWFPEAAKPAGEDLIEEARRRGMARPQSELQERAERIKQAKAKRARD